MFGADLPGRFSFPFLIWLGFNWDVTGSGTLDVLFGTILGRTRRVPDGRVPAVQWIPNLGTPTVNGGNLRCRRGDCEPCYGNYRTSTSDDCLTDAEERAWSSPIWVNLPE